MSDDQSSINIANTRIQGGVINVGGYTLNQRKDMFVGYVTPTLLKMITKCKELAHVADEPKSGAELYNDTRELVEEISALAKQAENEGSL